MTGERSKITEEKAFSRMATICAKRECCEQDIRRKLARYELDDATTDRVVRRLKKERYLDEVRFCRSFINDKYRFNKWGRTKIEFALRQKQLPPDVVSEAFGELPDISWSESLLPLLRSKLKTVKGASAYEKRGKLIRFALGRGFGMDDVIRCVDNLFADKIEE